MKNRNKSYNPRKHFDSYIRTILSKSLIVYFVNENHPDTLVELISMTGDRITVTSSLAKVLESHKHQWSVMLGIFYIEKGRRNCSFLIAEADKPRMQSEMVHDLNTEHQEFIESKKKQGVEVLGAGWIASPVGLDLDEELCGKIFDKLGAFDYER